MSENCGPYLPLSLSGTITSGSGYVYSLPVTADKYVDANTYLDVEDTSRPCVLRSAVSIKDLTHSSEEFVEAFNASRTTDGKVCLRNYFYRYILPHLRKEGTLRKISQFLNCADENIRSRAIDAMRNLIFELDLAQLKIKSTIRAAQNIASYLVHHQDECKDEGLRLFTDIIISMLVKEKTLLEKEIPCGLREVQQIISKVRKTEKGLVWNNLNDFLGKCLKYKMSKQGSKLIQCWKESSTAETEVQNLTENVQSVSPVEIYLLLLGSIFRIKSSLMPSCTVESFLKIAFSKLVCVSPSKDKKYEASIVFLADFVVRGTVFLFDRKLLSCHSGPVKESLLEAMKIVCSPKSLFSALPCEVLKLVQKIDPKDACSIWSNLCLSDDQFQAIVQKHAQSQIPGLVLRDLLNQQNSLLGRRSDHSNWILMNGTFMSSFEVEIKIRIPGRHPTKLNVSPLEDIEFNNTETEFEILKHIQGDQQHINVVQMLAFFDTNPRSFAMFAVERYGLTLLKYLYNVRSRNDELTLDWKVKRCLEMISAIDFLHHHNIVHRDIMAISFSLHCQGPDQGMAVLTSIRRAISNEVGGNTSCIGHVRDLNATQIPTRWSAPESFIQDKFDRKSDIWMLGHAIREVFTCGCQPYTEIYSEDTGNIIVKVIYCGLKPYKWSCIPIIIHSLTLRCFEMAPEKRPTISEMYRSLKEIQNKESDKKGKPGRSRISSSSTYGPSSIYGSSTSPYPKLNDGQMHCEPERGVPKIVRDLRKRKSDPRATYICLKYQGHVPRSDYRISEKELWSPDTPQIIKKTACLEVREPVSQFFYEKVLRKMSSDFVTKMQIQTWPLDPQLTDEANEFPFDIEYKSPAGKGIMELAGQHFSQTDHLNHMIEVAKLMEKMHDKYWILVDVCGQNFYLSTDTKEAFMPRIGRMLRLELPFDPDYDVVICPKVHKNRIHWNPIEVIRNSEYSMNSDVYMLAMVFYEYYTAVGLHKFGGNKQESINTATVPFTSVEYNLIMDHLLSGEMPIKPSECPVWLYENIMVPCWTQERTSRPSIKQIVSLMNERLEAENLKEGTMATQGYAYDHDYLLARDRASTESDTTYDDFILQNEACMLYSTPGSNVLQSNTQGTSPDENGHAYLDVIDINDTHSTTVDKNEKVLSCAKNNKIDDFDSPEPCLYSKTSKRNLSFERAFRNDPWIKSVAKLGSSPAHKSNLPLPESVSNENELFKIEQIDDIMPCDQCSVFQSDSSAASCVTFANDSADSEDLDSDIEFVNNSDNDN